jgi:ParB family chromosome partitioning protein
MQKPFAASALMKGIIEEIDISKISAPKFIFRNLDENLLNELAISIRQHGLLNPIIIRTKNFDFEIVTGVSRLLACKKLGYKKVLSHIIEVNDIEAFEISLIENIQRKSLSPLEEANAFKAYIIDFGWGGISSLSAKICKSVSYIYKRLSILELPQEIIDNYKNCLLNNSTLEELVFLKDHDKQIKIARQAIDNNMTVLEIRGLIKIEASKQRYQDYSYELPSTSLEDLDIKTLRSFDKSITTLKIALNKLGTIINTIEENWIAYEMLMQHKNMLNNQIDILIKEKRKTVKYHDNHIKA